MLEWIQDNQETLIELVLAIYAVISLIVGLTPSKEDDSWLKKAAVFISFLTPKDAPGTVKVPLTYPEFDPEDKDRSFHG